MTTLVEQLFQRWELAAADLSAKSEATDLAQRAQYEARRVRDEAAAFLHKALGERRVLIGNRVVWTVREDNDVRVHYANVVTPDQVEPEKVMSGEN
jgi:hypothetical protein